MRVAALVAGIVAAVGCTPTGLDLAPLDQAPKADRIAVRNATTANLTVVVNGAPVRLVSAETDQVVSLLGRAGPPYHIELLTPSGTSVMSFDITLADHREVVGGQVSSSVGGSTDCGWVEIAYGSDVFQPPDPMAAVPTAGGVCP